MASFITILLFFVYCWGLGTSLCRLVQESENRFERHIMRLGFGLAGMALLGTFLNLVSLPIDWRIFLAVAAVPAAYFVWKDRKTAKEPTAPENQQTKFKLAKSDLYILGAIAIFAVSFFTYGTGAFSYPYLEDGDSWIHAGGIRYISEDKTAYDPYPESSLTMYLRGKVLLYSDPYPPGYDIIQSVLDQTAKDLLWSMKFFNALIISLGILWFYFFAKEFTGSRGKGLFATFVLAALPSYLSHFIWAYALITSLFWPTLYVMEKTRLQKRWAVMVAIMVASLFVIHPEQGLKFGFIYLSYWIVRMLLVRKWEWSLFWAGSAGIAGALALWWVPVIARTGFTNIYNRLGLQYGVKQIGSADRIYSFSDFFIAKGQNMINNPVGLGVVVTLLMLLGIVILAAAWKKYTAKDALDKHYLAVILAWFIVGFVLVMGAALPFSLYAFRSWVIFALPVSLLATEATWSMSGMLRKFAVPSMVVLLVIGAGIAWTSFAAKYEVNTAQWGPDAGMMPPRGVLNEGYLWMKDGLPAGSKVVYGCNWPFADEAALVFGHHNRFWDRDEIDFKEKALAYGANQTYSFFKGKGYDYVFYDRNCLNAAGNNATAEQVNKLVDDWAQSGKFQPVRGVKLDEQNYLWVMFKLS